jgi:hypothetical protein
MPDRTRGPYSRLNAALRHVLWACAVVLLVLIAGLLFVKTRVNDTIRAEVERRLARHYAGLQVSVRSARLIEGRGIEVHGVSLVRPSDGARLAYVDEVLSTCAIGMEQLLAGVQPQAEHMLIRGLKLRAERSADGAWSFQQLWPLPRFGTGVVPVTLKEASVEVVDAGGNSATPLVLRDIDAEISPEAGSSSPAGPPTPSASPGLKARCRLSGDHFASADLHARVDPQSGRWSVSGRVDGLRLSPQTYALVPRPWCQRMGLLAAVSGTLTFNFQVAGDGRPDTSPAFTISGELSGGQAADPRFGQRLHDLRMLVYCDNTRLKIDVLEAHSGPATLTGTLERRGWADNSPLELRAEGKQLEFDPRIVEVLPESFQTVWRKYFPAGVVNASVALAYDGHRWNPEITVECLDVSFEYYKFPYRLERTRGLVQLKDGVLSLHVNAMAGDQAVQIDGEFRDPLGKPYGWVEFACRGLIPLDQKLRKAVVDPKSQEIVTALDPGGALSVTGRFERLRPGDPAFQKQVRIQLHNATMRYARFPYPLSMINGLVIWDERGWTFRNLTGRNHGGAVECEGSWTPASDGGRLVLNLIGSDVLLEDELREALSPRARRVWTDLRPRGGIDHVRVTVQYTSADKHLSLDVLARNWKRHRADEGRSVTLHPVWFPYRLDEVCGAVHYHDGVVEVQNLTAVHNDTEVRASGRCAFDDAGHWGVEFSNLVADRLRLDRELLTALPGHMGKTLGKMNMDGDVSLQGYLALEGQTGGDERPTVRWDLTVDMENGTLQCGLPLRHIHGEVRLVGTGSDAAFVSHGELRIDSLTYKDVQVTQVRGPLRIDGSHVLLGAAADAERADGPPRLVTGSVCGGRLSADVRVELDGDNPFHLQLRLDQGDLTRCMREAMGHSPDIVGKINTAVTLRGTAQGPNSWRGKGAVRLYEADIYEVPVLLAVLKLLSIRRPDRTAFTSSDIDFRIQGEHVYFDRINFNGDAISLRGSGEMNLERRINLQFYTLVGRTDLNLPVVRAIVSHASQQLLLIHVSGTVDEPQLTREPLPMLKETLEQIFPEVAAREPLRSLPVINPLEALLRDRPFLRQ